MGDNASNVPWPTFFFGFAFVAALFLAWMGAPALAKDCYRRHRRRRQMEEPSNINQHQNLDGEEGIEVIQSSATNPIEQQQQQRNEVEVFLAEIQRSSAPNPSLSLLTQARKEYVSNLLISKRVLTQKVEGGEESKERDDTAHKGNLYVAPNGASAECTGDEKGSNQEIQALQCPICLIEYQEGQEICWSHNKRCNHHFHADCIKHWLYQQRDDCPCCRNNYLALSDDDDEDEGESQEEEAYYFSYLSQFTRMSEREFRQLSEGMEQVDRRTTSSVDPPGRILEQDPESGILDTASAVSSNTSSVYIETGRWTDDEETLVQQEEEEEADPDEWSCPSVHDDEEIFYHYPLRRRRRARRRLQIFPPCLPQQPPPEVDPTVSLELGDLVVEGLMRRLEGREEERSSRTESSSSVYTHGSDDHDDQSEANSPIRSDTNVCAICRCEYLVSQELCWSQDPLCNHVFHRQCMQTWVLEHGYCPFCQSQEQEEDITAPTSSISGPNADSHDAEDTKSVTSELFVDTEKLVSSFEADALNEPVDLEYAGLDVIVGSQGHIEKKNPVIASGD